MPAKTLYVKDEQLWEKAKRLAGHQGFSGVIMRLLAKWVADKEKQEAMKSGKEFSAIELWVGGDEHQMWHPKDPLGGDHKIAFTGRLLHSSEHEVVLGVYPQVDVYQMGGGQLVVYRTWRPPFLIDSGLSPGYDGGATYKIFSDIEELLQNSEVLDTNWTGHPEEDQLQALVERPRTVRERLIITIAEHVKLEHPQRSAVWQKEYVREFLLGLNNTRLGPPKDGEYTEQEIDQCYEDEEQAACDLRFQQNIASALGAELVVRIDQSPHVSSPTPQIGRNEAAK